MIDIDVERLIPISAVPKSLIGAISGRIHLSTVYRWASNGICGVKLETVKIGGRRYTSEQAIRRFVAESTRAASSQEPPTPASLGQFAPETPSSADLDAKARRLGI